MPAQTLVRRAPTTRRTNQRRLRTLRWRATEARCAGERRTPEVWQARRAADVLLRYRAGAGAGRVQGTTAPACGNAAERDPRPDRALTPPPACRTRSAHRIAPHR